MMGAMDILRIDCECCIVRGSACKECVISVLCGPDEQIEFNPDEQRAIASLVAVGLVPPLRMQQCANGTEG